jgi:hypothetical protein
MDYNKISNIFFMAVYFGAVGTFSVLMAKAAIQKRRARSELKASILAKLKASIPLSAKDINTMARGIGLARASISNCISKLLMETNEPQAYVSLQKLAAELEKTEPFEDLPLEVKPSLIRLQELVEESSLKSDIHLLSPIQRALGSYVEQKAEVESSKRVAKWINIISIVGFIVGLWGFYFAWKSPDAKEIEAVVKKAIATSSSLSAAGPAAISAPTLPAPKQ